MFATCCRPTADKDNSKEIEKLLKKMERAQRTMAIVVTTPGE
jgi:hypothetical protein